MTTILLLIALCLAYFNKSDPDKIAITIFCVGVLAHEVLFSGSDAFLYCATESVTALLVITYIYDLRASMLIYRLMIACFASIILSLAGWVMWNHCFSVSVIDALYVVLYLYVVLIIQRGNNARMDTNSSRNSIFYACNLACCDPGLKIQGKNKN